MTHHVYDCIWIIVGAAWVCFGVGVVYCVLWCACGVFVLCVVLDMLAFCLGC